MFTGPLVGLEVCCGISLGMNIRYLFQLERAFECNRILNTPPEIEKIIMVAV